MTNKERMSQIGEVMDELVKLGFKANHLNPLKWDNFINFANNTTTAKRVNIFFGLEIVNVDHWTYGYTSPTWRQDIINQVK